MTTKSIPFTNRLGPIVSRRNVSRRNCALCYRRAGQTSGFYGVRGAAVCLLAACLLGGCSSDIPFPLVPIQGTITYEDGTPIPGVYLQFVPQTPELDKKTYPRPGVAEVAGNGTIELVTTYNYADGIIPGKHKVIVMALDEYDNRTLAVDEKYGSESTTPLLLDTEDVPFLIKIEKPSQGSESTTPPAEDTADVPL
jgi:hypothetical protein